MVRVSRRSPSVLRKSTYTVSIAGTFATAAKLERTFDLPVIGTISHTLTEAARVLRQRKMKQFYAASGGLGALFVVLLAVEFVQRGMVA